MAALMDYLRSVMATSSAPVQADAGNGQPTRPLHPTMFQRDPMIIGGPELVRIASAMLAADPDLKRRTKEIVAAPTGEALDTYMGPPNYANPEDFDSVALFGQTATQVSPRYRTPSRVFLNPQLSEPDQIETLMHELTHVAGADLDEPDDPRPNVGERLWLHALYPEGGEQPIVPERPLSDTLGHEFPELQQYQRMQEPPYDLGLPPRKRKIPRTR